MRQILYNALIVNEGRVFKGYVEISDDGLIAEVGEGDAGLDRIAAFGDAATDLHGNWLMPGVIDSHVHFREPGGEHKATIWSESRAAVAGGVTSFMEMPNTTPPTVCVDALEDKFRRAASSSLANYSFWIGAARDNVDELMSVDYSRVPGIKLFMGSSTGGMLVDAEDSLAAIFKLPVLIAAHCEDESTIRRNLETVKTLYAGVDGMVPGVEWHPQIRDVLACYKSTAHAVSLARKYGARLHVMHLTTAHELSLFAAGDRRITAEACVAHLRFTDEDYARLGTRIKCNPAVKSAMHRNALLKAVRDGLVSTISTDHAPHTSEEKARGLFEAPSGMPMVQFSLPAMLDLVHSGSLSVETVVQKMCHAQADVFGVMGRGYVRPGYAADLVQVDPNAVTEVRGETILSKCGWSPLEGEVLRSKVIRTWVNGREVYDHRRGILETDGVAAPLVFRR